MEDTTTVRRRKRRPQQQDVSAAQDPDALLFMETVQTLTTMAPSTVRAAVRAGRFPKPIALGPRSTRWRAGDIRDYLQARAQGLSWVEWKEARERAS